MICLVASVYTDILNMHFPTTLSISQLINSPTHYFIPIHNTNTMIISDTFKYTYAFSDEYRFK